MRLADGRPPRLDMYGHNPFSVRAPKLNNPLSPFQQYDFSDVARLAELVDRNLGTPANSAPPLFFTEWTIPTAPDREFNYYVDPRLHPAAALWGHHPQVGSDLWCGSWKIFWPDGRPLPHDECPMAVTLKTGQPVRGVEAVAERLPFCQTIHTPVSIYLGAISGHDVPLALAIQAVWALGLLLLGRLLLGQTA